MDLEGQECRAQPGRGEGALGSELDSFAAKAGVAKDQAADGIAKALPELVDKLTPDGSFRARKRSRASSARSLRSSVEAGCAGGEISPSGAIA